MRKILKWLAILFAILVAALFIFGWKTDLDATEMKAKYSNASSQFVNLGGGLSVHTRDEGNVDGPALVLIHGSNSSLHTWEPWEARLGQDFRIISMDLPGHGLTGANPPAIINTSHLLMLLTGL